MFEPNPNATPLFFVFIRIKTSFIIVIISLLFKLFLAMLFEIKSNEIFKSTIDVMRINLSLFDFSNNSIY